MVSIAYPNAYFPARAPMTLDAAHQVLARHFDLLDTAAGRGGKDGLIGRADIEAILRNPGAPPEVRDAARFLLANPAMFNQLDVAAGIGRVDGLIGRKDIDAYQPSGGGAPIGGWPCAPSPYGIASGFDPRAAQAQIAAARQAAQLGGVYTPGAGNQRTIADTAAFLVREHEAKSTDEPAMFDRLQGLSTADRLGSFDALGGKFEAIIEEMLNNGGDKGKYSGRMGQLLATLARDAQHDPRAQEYLKRALAVVDAKGGNRDDNTIRSMVDALGGDAERVLGGLPRDTRQAMVSILKEGNYEGSDKNRVEVINRASVLVGEQVF